MKLIIFLSSILLTGCSLLDAYLLKYDANEYLLISDVKTLAEISQDKCSTQETATSVSIELEHKSTIFKNYVQYMPRNEAVKKASLELHKIVVDFRNMYKSGGKVSPAFCKIKLKTISDSSEVMQKTIGAKPR